MKAGQGKERKGNKGTAKLEQSRRGKMKVMRRGKGIKVGGEQWKKEVATWKNEKE